MLQWWTLFFSLLNSFGIQHSGSLVIFYRIIIIIIIIIILSELKRLGKFRVMSISRDVQKLYDLTRDVEKSSFAVENDLISECLRMCCQLTTLHLLKGFAILRWHVSLQDPIFRNSSDATRKGNDRFYRMIEWMSLISEKVHLAWENTGGTQQ
jgi:hypothetical protein